MDSFYGGKQGVSFVIKASFNSINEMVENFKEKNDNKAKVWFGEYCLIDTVNKNDKNNGKIFRRGIATSTNAALGGAEYIGQIVGPSSGTPLFQFDTLNNVINHNHNGENENYDPSAGDIRVYPTSVDDKGNINGYNYRKDENGQYKDFDLEKDEQGSITFANNIKTLSYTVKNESLIPGKTVDEKGNPVYNNDIKWTWCNIKKANENSESWFYVGFQIPYLVNEFTSESVYPYDDNGNYKDTTALIPIQDRDKEGNLIDHPFYQKYTLRIPKGIKGDSLNGIKVITLNEDYIPNEQQVAKEKIYNWNQFVVDNQGKTNLNTETIEGITAPVSPGYTKNLKADAIGRQILVYEYRINDRSANGETYLVYVGDFNVVEKINLSQDGTLKIYYTHDGDRITENDIPKFVKTQKEKLRWVQSLTINEDTGDITLIYNTEDDKGNKQEPLAAKLKKITNASVNNKGNLIFGFNTKTNDVQDTITVLDSTKHDEQGNLNTNFVLRTIEEVFLNEGLDQDRRINVRYNVKRDNSKSEIETIGSPLNGIYSTMIDESNFHLLILFDDKEHRYNPVPDENSQLPTSPHVITEQEATNYIRKGSVWVKRTSKGETTTATSGVYWWLDLGSVKDDAGVLVGLNVTQKMIDDSIIQNKTILDYLNYTYPNGLISNQQGKSLIGKIVTYGDIDSNKKFYAFDYNYEGTDNEGNTIYGRWYYLGEIAANDQREIKMYSYTENITKTVSDDNKLTQEGGIALYYKSISEDFGLLPTYWKQ